MSLLATLDEELAQMGKSGTLKRELVMKGPQGPVVEVEGKGEVIMLTGADSQRERYSIPDAKYDPTWDWHAQNIKMVEALKEMKYDFTYVWGIGTHSNKQGGAIMPEMLRWLWRDYPRPDDPQLRLPRLSRPGAARACR